MESPTPFSVRLDRFWLQFLICSLPFSLGYITQHPAAISYLNLISVGFILLGFYNLLTGRLPYAPFRDRQTLLVIGLLLVAMAFALLFTHPLRDGVGLWTSRLLQPLLVAFFAHQLFANRHLRPEGILLPLLISLVGITLLAGLQLLHLLPESDPGRVNGLYHHVNTLARYLDIVLLLCLPWLAFAFSSPRRNLTLLLWGSGLLVLLTTKSYNGVLSLGIGLIGFFLLLPARYSKLRINGLAGIAAVAALIATNLTKLPKWQTTITDSRLTRLEFWVVAIRTIREHFWTGIGIKGWESQYSQLVIRFGPNHPPLNWVSEQPHNIFLDSLLKAGPLGLLAVSLLLIWPVVQGYRLLRSKPFQKYGWFGLAMICYGSAMLAFGLIDDPLWSDDTVPLLFICLVAVSWCLYQSKDSELSSS